ncbi:MAG: TolB family protein [Chitinophagaceae bacterium]
MKPISLCFILLYVIITTHAQSLKNKIVFSHHNDTSTVHPDTIYSIDNASQKTFVTLGYRPRVSHNGNYMAFANGEKSNQSLDASVYIRNLVTHKDTLIFFNGGDYLDYYDFSPHDSQLAYGFACSMYASNIDGTNNHDIGCTPCDCYSDQPIVRLTDSAITYHNVHFGIYTKNFDGSNSLQVPHTYPGDLYPVWSPDGQWIAYYKTTPGLYYVTNSIYKIKPNGTDSTLVLQLGVTDTLTPDLVWASDMKNIYFIARIQNLLGIYKVKTDGSDNYQKIYAFDTTGSVNDYWLGLSDSLSEILPLTLINFTAAYEGKTVNLAWQTTQEINSSYFDIERSIDGISFSKIGTIAAKGNNNSVTNYSFSDNALPYKNTQQQIVNYRLKIVDKDGQFTYSKIVSVCFTASSLVRIYPNPAKNILQIEGLNSSAPSTISIINISGNIVKQITVENNNYLFDVGSLAAGTYRVSIEQNKKTTNLKFLKE